MSDRSASAGSACGCRVVASLTGNQGHSRVAKDDHDNRSQNGEDGAMIRVFEELR